MHTFAEEWVLEDSQVNKDHRQERLPIPPAVPPNQEIGRKGLLQAEVLQLEGTHTWSLFYQTRRYCKDAGDASRVLEMLLRYQSCLTGCSLFQLSEDENRAAGHPQGAQ